jgi:hypothetical protein
MESLKLRVTRNVLAQTQKAKNQEQIAIRYTDQTGSLASSLPTAWKDNCIDITIAGAMTLAFCDTSAIWRAHNPGKKKEFDALFEFLSRFPDQEFEFVCALTK